MGRLVTLNIRHGGARNRIPAMLETLVEFDADVLVVTEFRNNQTGHVIVDKLNHSGYTCSHADAAPTVNTVLVASRTPITASGPIGRYGTDPRHLWAVDVGWTTIGAVYMPQKHAKLPYWDTLIDEAAAGTAPSILLGDLNTGTNTLDKDPRGVRFVGADRIPLLLSAGFTDAWRDRHPDTREYTWFSPAGNGFRLDHAYVHERLAASVNRCEYDQVPRLAGVTDHAAMFLEIDG